MASVADAWRCLFGTCLTCPCCLCKRDGDSWQRTDDVSRIAGWCNTLAGLAMSVCVAFRNVRRVSCCHHCHEALPFSGNNMLPFPKRWWYPSTTLLMYLLLLFPFSRLNPLPSPKRFSSISAGRNSAARVTCAEPFFFSGGTIRICDQRLEKLGSLLSDKKGGDGAPGTDRFIIVVAVACSRQPKATFVLVRRFK